MSHEKQNYTIVVNWKGKGFGCRKNCSYRGWRILFYYCMVRKMLT